MLTNTNHYEKMRRIETEYYQQYAPKLITNPPACTFMQVEAIEDASTLFQVDAIGVIETPATKFQILSVATWNKNRNLTHK